jgi:exodeoxyribonuclease VII small subunit
MLAFWAVFGYTTVHRGKEFWMSNIASSPLSAAKGTDELSFEEAYRELESVVERLEGGDLPLEEALELYERGVGLAQRCGDALDAAELRVRQLAPELGYRELPSDNPG